LRAWHINRELQNGVDVFAAIDKSGVSQPYRLVASWRSLRPDERSQRNPEIPATYPERKWLSSVKSRSAAEAAKPSIRRHFQTRLTFRLHINV
jgi:hypothetical protein